MIDKKIFVKVINAHEKALTHLHNLCDLGVDLFETPTNYALDTYIGWFAESHFSDEGVDCIFWYLFERPSEDATAYVIKNVDMLWDYVKDHRK